MYFKVLSIILLCLATHVKAQNNPEKVVSSFGEALSSWCSTNEIVYREKIDELCSGPKKCRVEDKIHAEYQIKRGLTNYETFVLDSYMNMFQSLMSKSVNYQMSNVKVVGSDEMPDGTLTFISADIKVSGALDHTVTDLFLVRNNKITGIYSYSSSLGFSHLNGRLINALLNGRYKYVHLCISNSGCYTIVKNEADKCGLIDAKGEVIVPCIWDDVLFFGDFVHGYKFSLNPDEEVEGRSITYDLRYGGTRTPLYHVGYDYTTYGEVLTFSDDLAVAMYKDGKYGYLRYNDNTYNVLYMWDYASPFCDGFALVEFYGTHMIIDKNFNPKKFNPILQDAKNYTICGRLSKGLVRVQDRFTGRYGFINIKGELIIPCIYNVADNFSSDGLCTVLLGSKFGCINTKGEIVIPFIYDSLSKFENGYIIAGKDGRETLLGIDGKPLSGFSWEYDEVRRIYEGFARFEKDGKYGFLTATGEVAVPAKYDYAYDFSNGIACIEITNEEGKRKYGGINTDGILVIPSIYDSFFEFYNGIALVEKDNQIGLIDVYGNSTFLPKQQK